MTGVTAATLAFVLAVLTPSLFPYLALRLAFPHARVLRPSDGSVIALACLLGIIANGTLIASLVARFSASPAASYAFSSSWLWLRMTGDFQHYEALRPGLWLLQKTLMPAASDLNLLAIIGDLHLRPLLLATALVSVLLLVPWVFDVLETRRDGPSHSLLARLSRTWIPVKGSEAVEWARQITHHPWQYLTSSNRRHELTLIDLLTHEGSLYSGKLQDWLPNGDDVSALSITSVLRFYPAKAGEQRTRAFVPNRGELVIPMQEIRTAHIWRVRMGTRFSISVRKPADIERVKWILALDFEHPGYFEAIDLQVQLDADQRDAFESGLAIWGEQVGITASDRVSLIGE
jgi:hypothetical protein